MYITFYTNSNSIKRLVKLFNKIESTDTVGLSKEDVQGIEYTMFANKCKYMVSVEAWKFLIFEHFFNIHNK